MWTGGKRASIKQNAFQRADVPTDLRLVLSAVSRPQWLGFETVLVVRHVGHSTQKFIRSWVRLCAISISEGISVQDCIWFDVTRISVVNS